MTRAAVALAVAAVPLLATGPAQAAIAGANQLTTSGLPDLQSATILSTTSVEVCFSKPITTPNSATFSGNSGLGGYRSARLFAPSSVLPESGKNNCVIANYPQPSNSNQQDINQYTIYTVAAGVVHASSGGGGNLADSVTLAGSTTHNGTTGLTTAPDLVGVAPFSSANTSGNTVTFVFDQNVDNSTTTPDETKFWLEDASGNICRGVKGSRSLSGSSITITFPNTTGYSTACNINNAVRAGVDSGAVFAAADPHSGNATQGVAISGTGTNGGNTQLPDLISAQLLPSGNQVSYTFDKSVLAASINETQFQVWLSNGTLLTGDAGSATVGSSGSSSNNTVTVTFNNAAGNAGQGTGLAKQDEYAVIAAVTGNAASTSGTPTGNNGFGVNGNTGGGAGTNSNSPGSAPIGDNAGAFGRGFTTGADAYAATVNKTNGVVQIAFDQRVTGAAFCANFIDSSGNSTFVCPSSVSPTTEPANAGPETLTMQFTAAQVASVAGIQLLANSVSTGLSSSQASDGAPAASNDANNVVQVFAPVSSSAHLKAAKHHKKHAKKHAKRH